VVALPLFFFAMKKALILDACCGGRMFWFEKEHDHVLFMDTREVEPGAFANGWNPNWSVKPDIVGDFRSMPFEDLSFKMVVFDPPHVYHGTPTSVINTKYGLLDKNTWQQDLVAGFTECWRVLDHGGTLIFKWHEATMTAREIVKMLPEKPLFGDFTGKTGKTIWMTFFKP